MMTIMRWDRVNSTADFLNNIGADQNNPPPTPFFSPVSTVRNRFTPGIQFLIHANIKTSFEYQIRPRQIVYSPNSRRAHYEPVPHELCGGGPGVCVLRFGENFSPAIFNLRRWMMKRTLVLAVLATLTLALAANAGTINGKVSGVSGESVVYVDVTQGKTFPAPTNASTGGSEGIDVHAPHHGGAGRARRSIF